MKETMMLCIASFQRGECFATPEHAQRITACVNACEGIPTWALERLGIGGLWNVLNDVLHQLSTDSDLDELVTAPQKYKVLEQMVRDAIAANGCDP